MLINLVEIKGELQHQNKLISYKRAFRILKKDTKITETDQAICKIFGFFLRKEDKETKLLIFYVSYIRWKTMDYVTS